MNYGLIQSMIKNKWYNHYNLKVGQSLEIHEKMWEGDNQRVWKFKCIVIAINRPNNHDGAFTVIGESSGVKIEKTYPLSFYRFDKIILLDEGKVRKSKLYYQKTKVGKDARMKSLIKKEDRWVEIVPIKTEIVDEVTPTIEEVEHTQETMQGIVEEKMEVVEEIKTEVAKDSNNIDSDSNVTDETEPKD